MNYNEMSAAQCADWLAVKDGWKIVDSELPPCSYWWNESTQQQRVLNDPPYKLTLDAAAGALPAKMFFYVNYCILFGEETYVVCAVTKGTRIKEFRSEGPDELTARYRAAVAARMEEDNAK